MTVEVTRAALAAARRSRSSPAPSSPPRRCSRTGWSRSSPTRRPGPRCPTTCGTGSSCRPRSAACREPGRLLVETFPRGGHAAPLPLRLRRPQRPPDPRPAGHPAHGDRRAQPARLRRQRLRAADLGPRRGARPGRAARRRTACATGLEGWLGENAVMKRTFRNAATVAGLIEQNLPGPAQDRPAGDLLLRHPLRHAAQVRPRPPAAADHPRRGRARPRRLRPHRGDAGAQRGRIDVVRAPHVTPLAAPLFLEMGRVPIKGRGRGAAGQRGGGRAARRGGPRLRQSKQLRRGWRNCRNSSDVPSRSRSGRSLDTLRRVRTAVTRRRI